MLERVSQAMAARDATEEQLRRFVADASHELRTPLATIRAYAEFGQSPETGEMPAETADALARITVTADRMASLVTDLLLLARLDAGRPLARGPVDLTRLVLDAVADAKTAAPEHRWRLDLPEHEVTVTGDADRLHQVLANLLTNARTHTPPGTTVTAVVRDGPLAVEVLVRDDGPGIPRDRQLNLFDRFSRGDTSRSRAPAAPAWGWRSATQHRCRAWRDPDRGQHSQGELFRLRLPAAAGVFATAPAQSARNPRPPEKPHRGG